MRPRRACKRRGRDCSHPMTSPSIGCYHIHMRQLLYGIVVILLLTAGVARAQDAPSTRPQLSDAEQRQLDIAAAEREVAVLPTADIDDLERLIRFDVEHGMLMARTPVSPLAGEMRIITPHLPGIVRLRVLDLPAVDDPSQGRNFTLIHNDLTLPGSTLRITHVASIAGRLMMARDEESDRMRSSIQLIQDPPGTPLEPDVNPVRLLIQIYDADGNPQTDLKLSARSFDELRRQHPRELETYFRPILRDFQQDQAIFAVDNRVAWQVLGDAFEPDARTEQRVTEALADFDADDFRQRETAIQKLHEIGQPAAIVLARMNRDAFSAEQNAGVDTFLAEYLPLTDADIRRLRDSEEFLLDALASDDPTLRSLAWDQLRKIAADPPPFDPAASAETRSAQLAALRAQLSAPATRPTGER